MAAEDDRLRRLVVQALLEADGPCDPPLAEKIAERLGRPLTPHEEAEVEQMEAMRRYQQEKADTGRRQATSLQASGGFWVLIFFLLMGMGGAYALFGLFALACVTMVGLAALVVAFMRSR